MPFTPIGLNSPSWSKTKALGERFGKLSVAILGNLTKDELGEQFVNEVRAPADRAIAIETAVLATKVIRPDF